MGIDSGVNISDDVAPYGGKSAFTQLEHNIVAGYLITAGNKQRKQLIAFFIDRFHDEQCEYLPFLCNSLPDVHL